MKQTNKQLQGKLNAYKARVKEPFSQVPKENHSIFKGLNSTDKEVMKNLIQLDTLNSEISKMSSSIEALPLHLRGNLDDVLSQKIEEFDNLYINTHYSDKENLIDDIENLSCLRNSQPLYKKNGIERFSPLSNKKELLDNIDKLEEDLGINIVSMEEADMDDRCVRLKDENDNNYLLFASDDVAFDFAVERSAETLEELCGYNDGSFNIRNFSYGLQSIDEANMLNDIQGVQREYLMELLEDEDSHEELEDILQDDLYESDELFSELSKEELKTKINEYVDDYYDFDYCVEHLEETGSLQKYIDFEKLATNDLNYDNTVQNILATCDGKEIALKDKENVIKKDYWVAYKE